MKLSKTTYWWLLISVVLGVLGWLANWRSQSSQLLPEYARQLSRYYEAQEKKLTPLLEDTLHWKNIFNNTQGPYTFPKEADIAFLQQWSQEDVVWMLFADTLPVFWTNNTLLIPAQLLAQLYQQEVTGVVRINTGFYVLKSQRLLSGADGRLLVVGAIPIKKEYPVEGPYLEPGFVANAGAFPDHLIIGSQGEQPVLAPDGTTLFYLSRAPGRFNKTWHLTGLVFYLLAFLFFALFINNVANVLARKFHPWLGAALIIGALALIGLLADWGGFRQIFSDTSFFRDASNTFIFNQSLGEFFINSLILLWLMVFFHREFQLKLRPRLSPPWPAIFTTVTYGLSIISLLIIIRLFQSLILESDLVFDFAYIFGLDFRTLLALISGLILILAVFLFNHRLLQTTSRLGISLRARLLAAVAAILLTWPVFFALHLEIAPLFVLMMAIVYVLGLDFTLDHPALSLTITVSWLLFFAVCTSIIVYSFRQKQDLHTQKTYAQLLTDPQDPILEEAVGRLTDRLGADSLVTFFSQVDSFPVDKKEFYPRLEALFSAEPYLFQHYEFELFGLDRRAEVPVLLLQGQRLGESMRLLEDRVRTRPGPVKDLSYWPEPNQQDFTYLLDLAPADSTLYLWMAFRPRSQKDQRVYGELIRPIPYKNLSQLPLYDYIIYGGLRQLKQSGKIPNGLRIPFPKMVAGVYYPINEQERSSMIYQNEQGFTVLLTRSREGLFQTLSLFSFLFSLLVLLVIILSVLNYYGQALPNTLEFTNLHKASLRNRIQRAVLLLILGSFILVGFFTAAFFRRNALRAGNEQLNEKAQAVLMDLQRNIGSQDEEFSGLANLAPLIEQIADIHNMDINIYNLQGQLQLTSAAYLFSREITAPLMNPIALQALRLPTQSSYRSDEQLRDLVYQSAYVPIRDGNEEIIAYLELPYYANDRELRNDLQSFLSALLNVYVFLLLLSGTIALLVAKSITQPISKIGQKLSQFRLGHNEPLEWKSPDEIGQLIGEYNLMIKKLEESAEKLRQSEREGAWREMAKQVAHEIKNPLTPMKLNIQHLLRVQQQDPERASSMLAEVAQSIIQQIDGLSRIAGEFSNFAQMPQAQNEYFELNKLVSSVYQLYAKGDHGTIELSLDLPDEKIEVFADSTQLMRVINNLIKNALQAIPDNRSGKVAIRLKKETEKAVLSVSDNGSGIPESLREKVFFPNFTTKNSGMGLGLAMSRSIVNTANGRIYFDTEEGKGTTFYVDLPVFSNKEG